LSPVIRQDRPLFLGLSVCLGWRPRFCPRPIDRCRGPIHVAIARGGRTGIAATIRSRWKCRRGGRCPWRDWDTAGPPRRRGIPPRPHDSSEIGAIYRANQERVATRGRGSSPLAMERPPQKDGGVQRHPPPGEVVALWYDHRLQGRGHGVLRAHRIEHGNAAVAGAALPLHAGGEGATR
jgi:hypothetical protein